MENSGHSYNLIFMGHLQRGLFGNGPLFWPQLQINRSGSPVNQTLEDLIDIEPID